MSVDLFKKSSFKDAEPSGANYDTQKYLRKGSWIASAATWLVIAGALVGMYYIFF